jgi:(E)-4-hydroxy-3-methyl-but-2-enyl pyrophosphate reductase
MKIVIAKTAGFCMGVRRAVDMLLDASTRYPSPIFTYGPLIHNPQVLQMLEEKKIFRIDKIPEKGEGVVLIRAHGVPPEDEKALNDAGFTVINATCPRVVNVQVIIRRYAKQGYTIIIAGDPKHPEVKGLLGYAGTKGLTVSSEEELRSLPIFDKAILVAQTTQNTFYYNELKSWCSLNTPHYKVFDTICNSTEKRQAEIRKLAKDNDAIIVVGGKESSNTRRLYQIAAETQKPALHIEDESEIDYKLLNNVQSISLTAGASTPNWIISDTYLKIKKAFQKHSRVKSFLYNMRDLLLKTNIMTAMGAGSLSYACLKLQGIEGNIIHALIAMFYILSMQSINNLFAIRSDRYNHPQRALFYKNNQKYLWILAILSGSAGLYLSFLVGSASFIILLIMTLLGLSYSLKIIPMFSGKKKLSGIKDIPGSKTIITVLAWGFVTCLLPFVVTHGPPSSLVIVFLFATGLVFARTAFFDILAIQGDRITGRETLPVIIGGKRTLGLIRYVLIFSTALLLLSVLSGMIIRSAFLFCFIPVIMLLLINCFKKNRFVSDEKREFAVECLFIATGPASMLFM